VFTAEVLKCLDEAVAHRNNTTGHQLEVVVPHLGQLFVAKYNVDNACAVDGRVGVKSSREGLDSRHGNIFDSGALSDHTDATNTLTVHAEVLGVGLEEHDVVGVLSEETQTVGIFLKITGGKTLVGRVERTEVVLGLNDIENFIPLGGSRVDTGGIVGANVQKDNGVVLRIFHVLEESFKVETFSVGVVVTVV